MPEPEKQYFGFLSYSHVDKSWAKWLQRKIEGHVIDADLVDRETSMGKVPKELRPIYRDRDQFSAGDPLKEQTITALEQSRALIVLCSLSSAKSHYVNNEIVLFKENHPDRPVIPVIISGTPGDIDEECFPEALRFPSIKDNTSGETADEILAADVRSEGDGRELAVARVVASLLGLGTDEIFRRAERERSKQQRRWIVRLSVVVAALAGLALWAEVNRRQAQENFALARQGADALVVDIAKGLRDVEGMRASAVLKILSRAEKVISDLVEQSGNDISLLRSKSRMLNEFVDTYIAVGDTDSAEKAAKDGVSVAQTIIESSDGDVDVGRDLGRSIMKYGDAFIETGKFEAARQNYEKSLSWRRDLSKQHPDNLKVRRDITVSLNRLGELEELRGRFSRSLKYFRTSLELRRELVRKKQEWRRDLIVNNIKVGDVLLSLKKVSDSRDAFDEARTIAQSLAAAKQDSSRHQRDLAIVQQRIGNLGLEAKDAATAETFFRQSIETFNRLAVLDPGQVEWKRDIAVSYMKLGHVARTANNDSLAVAHYQRCAERLRALLASNGNNVQWRIDLAETFMHLATSSQGSKRLEFARKAIDLLDQLELEKKAGNEQAKWREKLMAYLKG